MADPVNTNAASESSSQDQARKFDTLQIICMVIAAVATAAAIICLVIYGTTPIQQSSTSGENSVVASTNIESGAASSASANANTGGTASSSAATSSSAQSDQILPDSDERYYTEAELQELSDRELYLARNEIYARHGRGFKNQDLVEWFSSKDWYQQRYTPEEYDALPDQRNEYEHANADLMMEIEQERGSQYL